MISKISIRFYYGTFLRKQNMMWLLAIAVTLFHSNCGTQKLAGSISETTNGCVSGLVVTESGAPSARTQVKLASSAYDPLHGNTPLYVDTTNDSGRYVFYHVDSGRYTIQSIQLDARTRALSAEIMVGHDTVAVNTITLQRPGTVKVMLPDSVDIARGYVFVPGTDIVSLVNGNGVFAVLDSVPCGIITSVNYATTTMLSSKIIRYNIPVIPNDSTIVANPLWKYAKELNLNTTVGGANVLINVYNFPVLVRLSTGTFDFSQSQADGCDIRFTKPDNTPLVYEIERWDAENKLAEIWVKVDTVLGNNSANPVMMYWCNASAPDNSRSGKVFDTLNGFVGVWHLAEAGGATAYDATFNGYNGMSPVSAPAPVAGIIGVSRQFNGLSNYITMPGTASSKLNFPKNGMYSVSAWVKMDQLNKKSQVVVSKDLCQYTLQFRYDTLWEFHDFTNNVGFQSTTSPMIPGYWALVTGVRSGTNQYLYINGTLMDSTITRSDTATARVTSNDLYIGRLPAYDGWSQTWRYLNGAIDEVRITSNVPSADWVKLCYMNQKVGDALVVFK